MHGDTVKFTVKGELLWKGPSILFTMLVHLTPVTYARNYKQFLKQQGSD